MQCIDIGCDLQPPPIFSEREPPFEIFIKLTDEVEAGKISLKD